ncbi:SSI family serine proteinase inhibitor [Actinomadura sp. WMMA1423]|uniref:SSI family serine proteinase inhibitor n=1 Tax=Actinomadura sp. WMMA1423 TaxID=2591108 RepID=UPI00114653DF|nr:SSI family serine proteinase inhibitor [Actinomadura sp. WMMA1423]
MHMSRARFRWAAVLAGVAMLAPAVPARADGPAGAYLLSVVPQDGPATTRTLWCDPDGGTLGAASRACDQLEAAGGDVGRVPARREPCTLEYAPVTVVANGVWRGVPRYFTATYPNRCLAVRATGGILFGE